MTTNTTNAQLPKKRIEYIDALRGLTMILVVFSHVEMTSFGFETPTFINSLFIIRSSINVTSSNKRCCS